MPPLPAAFSTLLADAVLPLDDLAAQPLQALTLPTLRVIARQAVDLLGDGVGTLLVELGLPATDLPAPLTAAELAAAPGFAALLAGTALERNDANRLLARAIQRGLQALAARCRDAPRALRLTSWGSDGSFGDEAIAAVRSFQEWRQLPVSGRFGAAEARTMQAVLGATTAPKLFDAGHDVSVLGGGAQRIAAIARSLCAATTEARYTRRVDGVSYSYYAAQFGTAPTPGWLRAPGGVAYEVSSSPFWKCNIFGGTVLALAGLSVPTFEVGRYRHFPRAERFGDALASRPGWKLVTYLDHRDPDDPSRARTSRALDGQIKALLQSMKPGDLFFVDHPGAPGNDGGHTRVCTRAAQSADRDAAPEFAQARSDAAQVLRNGMAALGGGREIQFWLLRSTVR
jgi:hypothetical protein